MKNIKTSFFVYLLTAISFIGCTDSDDKKEAQASTGDYWPTSVDNNWVYTEDGEATSIKIIDKAEVSGAQYYEFDLLSFFGRAIAYNPSFQIKKDKGDYYINVGELNITAEGVTTTISGYEFIFFKDYLDINKTWEGKYTYTMTSTADSRIINTEGTYKGEILEKEISLTVKGIVFNNVIKFRFTQIIDEKDDAWPTWDYTTDYWIAKDVGIIKVSSNDGVQELKSYVVK